MFPKSSNQVSVFLNLIESVNGMNLILYYIILYHIILYYIILYYIIYYIILYYIILYYIILYYIILYYIILYYINSIVFFVPRHNLRTAKFIGGGILYLQEKIHLALYPNQSF